MSANVKKSFDCSCFQRKRCEIPADIVLYVIYLYIDRCRIRHQAGPFPRGEKDLIGVTA